MSATVRIVSEAGLQQRIEAGSHLFMADEPKQAGGDDTGPDPYALLLSALGACTNMTLLMYARHKKWPLEGVAVELMHTKVHADDCRECEGREGRVDRIERHIQVRGDLSEKQINRLAEIAQRCPVHQTLSSGSVVVDHIDKVES